MHIIEKSKSDQILKKSILNAIDAMVIQNICPVCNKKVLLRDNKPKGSYSWTQAHCNSCYNTIKSENLQLLVATFMSSPNIILVASFIMNNMIKERLYEVMLQKLPLDNRTAC